MGQGVVFLVTGVPQFGHLKFFELVAWPKMPITAAAPMSPKMNSMKEPRSSSANVISLGFLPESRKEVSNDFHYEFVARLRHSF